MALGKCRECGKPVSSSAATCPICGVATPYVKKSMGTVTKVILSLFAIGIVGNVFFPKSRGDGPAATSVTQPQVAPEKSTDRSFAEASAEVRKANKLMNDKLSARKDEHCFDAGAAIAKVYMANFRQAAEVGLMASTLMAEGCEKNAGAEGPDCVRQCETGFKVEVRSVLK